MGKRLALTKVIRLFHQKKGGFLAEVCHRQGDISLENLIEVEGAGTYFLKKPDTYSETIQPKATYSTLTHRNLIFLVIINGDGSPSIVVKKLPLSCLISAQFLTLYHDFDKA